MPLFLYFILRSVALLHSFVLKVLPFLFLRPLGANILKLLIEDSELLLLVDLALIVLKGGGLLVVVDYDFIIFLLRSLRDYHFIEAADDSFFGGEFGSIKHLLFVLELQLLEFGLLFDSLF